MSTKQQARKQHYNDYRNDREGFLAEVFVWLPAKVVVKYLENDLGDHKAAYDEAFKFARKNGMTCGEPGLPAHESKLRFLFDFEV